MKIIIKTTNIKLTASLRRFAEEKINSLEKFFKNFQTGKYFDYFFNKGKPRIEAWVEIGRISLHHRKGPFFRAEVQIRLSGKSIRSVAYSEDLKLAIVEVKNELQRQIKRYKEKAKDLARRNEKPVRFALEK